MAVGGDEPRFGHEIDLAVQVVNDVGPRLGSHGQSRQDE
jgi:hypothetical protein